MTARLQDAARFLVALHLVGKKHRAELAGHGVEASVLERQGQSVGLFPRNPAVGRLAPFGMIKHRLVEIGNRHACLCRKGRCKRARHHAGSRRRLQHGARIGFCQPRGEIARVGFKNERDHKALVHFGDRSRENFVDHRHH